MEIFQLPLDTTHLRHQLKWLAYVLKRPFGAILREVNAILADPALGKVWTRRRILARLLEQYGENDQRSSQWHAKRSEMITASEITKAFRSATPGARRELLLKKIEGAGGMSGGGGMASAACAWGTQFEPIAKEIYCRLNGGGKVVDTSCVVHPRLPFLGASPDGIYFPDDFADPRWGKLIEFKCPISRKFDETTPIPDAYYHQMQLQMECCNIDECDYVEMRFVTQTQTEWMANTTANKGRLVVFDSGAVEYDNGSPTWRADLKTRNEDFRVVHWALASWRIANVKRDYSWMATHEEELTEFWEEVLAHRRNGTVPTPPEKISEAPPSEPGTALPDAPSAPPPEASESQTPAGGSSSARKKNAKTLRLDLASCDQ